MPNNPRELVIISGKDGKLVRRLVGLRPESEYINILDNLLDAEQ